MNIERAKELLNLCEREELRDHAFVDREVFWTFDGVEVAGGYLGSTGRDVWIYEYQSDVDDRNEVPNTLASFTGNDADELAKCGTLKKVERNDMQGSDIPRYEGF